MHLIRIVHCLIIACLLLACQPQPVTPVTVLQFPATWTPAPTATVTPLPPTATLVIQRTRAPAATRDPNLKRLPTIPPEGIGVWLETENLPPDVITLALSNIEVITGPRALELKQRNSGAIALLRLGAGEVISATRGNSLDSRYAGVLIENGETESQAALDDTREKLEQARAALGTRLLVANDKLWTDGAAYFANRNAAITLLQRADGVCMCNFLRQTDTPLDEFKTESEWRQDIDALGELSSNRNLIVLVSVPFGQAASRRQSNPEDWLGYALGSFLLGINNTHAFFNTQGENADELVTAPMLATTLGSPLGAYATTTGVFERRFSKGIVLVNPSPETRARVFSRPFKTATNEIVTRMTLEPHTGIILLNAEE